MIESFRDRFIREEASLVKSKNKEMLISDLLTSTFGFMNRRLACRVAAKGGKYTVECKTYHVKTLAAEYEALFSLMRSSHSRFNFVSVSKFEAARYL